MANLLPGFSRVRGIVLNGCDADQARKLIRRLRRCDVVDAENILDEIEAISPELADKLKINNT